MKKIESDEIFRNLSDFLKGKGIELTQGTYSRAVQKTCSVLTDTINLSQEGFEKVRTGAERRLDQVRQVIHERTAPKPPQSTAAKPTTKPPASGGNQPSAAPAAGKPRRVRTRVEAKRKSVPRQKGRKA